MTTTAAVVGGLLVGLLLGRGRAPRFRWAPFLLATAALAVLILSLAVQPGAFLNGAVAGVSALIGSALWEAIVWKRRMPELDITLGGWMWRASLRPRYVQDLCRQVEEARAASLRSGSGGRGHGE
jgi:hypothetical protein